MALLSRRHKDKEQEAVSVTFDISPDGRQVVFSAGDLYLLDLKTYQVTRLTQTGRCACPAFSPDGTKIVYSASTAGETASSLYALSLSGKTVQRLTAEAETSDSQPSFSPDGGKITFTRAFRYRPYSMGGMVWSDYEVCIMQADGTDAKRLTTKKYYSVSRPQFTRDGNIVFSAEVPYDSQFSKQNSGGSLATLVQVSADVPSEPKILLPLPKPGKHSGAHGTDPDLSPDGQQIAFLSDKATPFSYDIYIMNRDGSNLRSLNVTTVSTYNGQPTYLPDGKSLLFLAGTETDSRSRPIFSLWKVNVDGSHAQRIADESLFLQPTRWKPHPPQPKDLASVKAALATGMSPSERDELGKSMLSNATSRGDISVVRLLLQKGANPNTPDTDGSTVLSRALEGNHLDVVRLLLAKGAKVNAAPQGGSMQGMPPLLIASLGENAAIAALLIHAGADVEAVAPQMGDTALHFACGGNVGLAKLLLSKGIPVDARNWMGVNPLDERGNDRQNRTGEVAD